MHEVSSHRLFELVPCGDPYNKFGWDIREYEGDTCWYRGDLSPNAGMRSAIRKLKQLYPGCKVKVNKNG